MAESFSPDGKRLVFCSTRNGNEDLFTMNADGSNVQLLVGGPDVVYESDWSPDGQQIAFYSSRPGDFELFLVKPNGQGLKQLTGKD